MLSQVVITTVCDKDSLCDFLPSLTIIPLFLWDHKSTYINTLSCTILYLSIFSLFTFVLYKGPFHVQMCTPLFTRIRRTVLLVAGILHDNTLFFADKDQTVQIARLPAKCSTPSVTTIPPEERDTSKGTTHHVHILAHTLQIHIYIYCYTYTYT